MEGVLSKGVLSEGFLSEGVLSGGGFVRAPLEDHITSIFVTICVCHWRNNFTRNGQKRGSLFWFVRSCICSLIRHRGHLGETVRYY